MNSIKISFNSAAAATKSTSSSFTEENGDVRARVCVYYATCFILYVHDTHCVSALGCIRSIYYAQVQVDYEDKTDLTNCKKKQKKKWRKLLKTDPVISEQACKTE